MSYSTHVNLMEDFIHNSPSIIHSSMYMSSVDILVYGEFYSWHDLVFYGRVLLCVLILGRANITSSLFWTAMQGRTTLSAYPHWPCFVNVAIGQL